jgi:hypothetical protein
MDADEGRTASLERSKPWMRISSSIWTVSLVASMLNRNASETPRVKAGLAGLEAVCVRNSCIGTIPLSRVDEEAVDDEDECSASDEESSGESQW